MKVSFKANKGNKFWAFRLTEGVRLIRCPLNTGFTVVRLPTSVKLQVLSDIKGIQHECNSPDTK